MNNSRHPCFDSAARHSFGRIHLPVAPRCNMQCNFCNRKYDCVNEAHPGVTSAVVTPKDALQYLENVIGRRPEIAVVGLAGPGDPFANPEETLTTLRLVRRRYPELLLCVATNGLAVSAYIDELVELSVNHVTITVNTMDPQTGARIYAWIRDGKRLLRGAGAASLLWERQREVVRALSARGITVKINSIIMPGINDSEVPEIARTMGRLGADVLNCMPMVRVRGSVFEDREVPDADLVRRVRSSSSGFLPQIDHCARCRSDAAGLIGESAGDQGGELKRWIDHNRLLIQDKRPFVAVASYEGALVNRHLGEAEHLMIYAQSPETRLGFVLKEIRSVPPRGGGDARWLALAETLNDCRALLVRSAGPKPQKVLSEQGIRIIQMEGLIEEGLAAVYSNREVPAVMRRRFTCLQGEACRGAGAGCG